MSVRSIASNCHDFKYTPIANSTDTDGSVTIRLLEILPGTTRSIIETRLIETTLLCEQDRDQYSMRLQGKGNDRKHRFAALSYEWGLPTSETAFIKVDGMRFTVRPYLWTFLQQIRVQWSHHLPAKFWVDSICINQDDLEEKARQVSIMHNIYSQAREVLVYLGPAADGSATVFRQLRLYLQELDVKNIRLSELGLGLKARKYGRTGIVLSIMRNTAEFEQRHGGFPSDTFENDPAVRQAVWKLCRRSYWTRAWIVQECLNAKHVTLFCGTEHLPRSAFPLLGHVCRALQHDEHVPGSSWRDVPGEDFDPANRVIELTRTWYSDRHNGLETLLQSYHGSKCSNPYDKVYAFLGLSSEANEFPIDYNIPLFTLLARSIAFCSESKGKRKTSKIDPIRKTCDSIHIGQLLGEDLGLFHDLEISDRLARNVPDSSEELSQKFVTIELDYLGKIACLPDSENNMHQTLFKVNLRTYRSLTADAHNSDRAFALRGTPLVLLYRRTLNRLHFVGLAEFTRPSISGETDPLLDSLHAYDANSGADDFVAAALQDHIEHWDFPAPAPIPRYHLQHGRFFLFRAFRSLIIPALPDRLAKAIMSQSPDSGFYASPSMLLPLSQVLEIICLWPKRVRDYKEYCEDLKLAQERNQAGMFGRVYRAVTDVSLRVKNTFVLRWNG